MYLIIKEDQEISKIILLAQSLSSRKRGRPRLCWRDELDENAGMFGIRNWWMARSRAEREEFLEEVKTREMDDDDDDVWDG